MSQSPHPRVRMLPKGTSKNDVQPLCTMICTGFYSRCMHFYCATPPSCRSLIRAGICTASHVKYSPKFFFVNSVVRSNFFYYQSFLLYITASFGL